MSVGTVVIAETTLLANAIRTAPHARVRTYPTWNLAQLGRHVGEIHGWATGIVRDGATERPSRAKLTDVGDNEIAGVLHVGAAALAEVLDACDPAASVWTFAGDGTNAFWRRRMLLETTIHRWDAEDAVGQLSGVDDQTALDGLAECVAVYLEPNLSAWTLSTSGAAVTATDGSFRCTVSGGPLETWLFVMGRRRLAGMEVTGDMGTATRFAEAIAAVRGPA